MTSSTELPPTNEAPTLGVTDQAFEYLRDNFPQVPKLEDIDIAKDMLATAPRDGEGKILNLDGSLADEELVNEVESLADESTWRMSPVTRKENNDVIRAADETKLNESGQKSFMWWQQAQEAEGKPADFAAYKAHASKWRELDDNLIRRELDEKARKESKAERRVVYSSMPDVTTDGHTDNPSRPKPGTAPAEKQGADLNTPAETDATKETANLKLGKYQKVFAVDRNGEQVELNDDELKELSESIAKRPQAKKYQVAKQGGKKWQWNVRSAEDLQDLGGVKSQEMQRKLVQEELIDLGLKPSEALVNQYLEKELGAKYRKPERAERDNKPSKMRAFGRTVLKSLQVVGFGADAVTANKYSSQPDTSSNEQQSKVNSLLDILGAQEKAEAADLYGRIEKAKDNPEEVKRIIARGKKAARFAVDSVGVTLDVPVEKVAN